MPVQAAGTLRSVRTRGTDAMAPPRDELHKRYEAARLRAQHSPELNWKGYLAQSRRFDLVVEVTPDPRLSWLLASSLGRCAISRRSSAPSGP
jgi:hypothetical protein